MTLKEKLKELQEREQEDLQNQIKAVAHKYEALPEKINKTAALSGIPPEELVSICIEITLFYEDFSWIAGLEIIRSFYEAKMRRDAARETS